MCVCVRVCACMCVCVCVCVLVGCMGEKVLAQTIRYRDYTIWMTLQGNESRVTTFRLRHIVSHRMCVHVCVGYFPNDTTHTISLTHRHTHDYGKTVFLSFYLHKYIYLRRSTLHQYLCTQTFWLSSLATNKTEL